jgi:hypothetical protein
MPSTLNRRLAVIVALAGGCLGEASTALAQLSVVSTIPARHEITVPRNAVVAVTFDRPVDPASFTNRSFHVFGKVTGVVTGKLLFENENLTATLNLDSTFAPPTA